MFSILKCLEGWFWHQGGYYLDSTLVSAPGYVFKVLSCKVVRAAWCRGGAGRRISLQKSPKNTSNVWKPQRLKDSKTRCLFQSLCDISSFSVSSVWVNHLSSSFLHLDFSSRPVNLSFPCHCNIYFSPFCVHSCLFTPSPLSHHLINTSLGPPEETQSW